MARKKESPPRDPNGMVVFLVNNGVIHRRLQIWKNKLVQMGATIELRVTKNVTHILAMSKETLLQEVGLFKGIQEIVTTGKLSKLELFETDEKIFSEFLVKEYGGPGTLVVEPFTDMFIALKENELPGAASAARSSLLWGQNYLDQDWDVWNSSKSSK